LAQRLLEWQWLDSGRNCEPLLPLRGLALHARMTGNRDSGEAAIRAAEVFLQRCLYKRSGDGEMITSDFTALHYPCYGHHDMLFGLKVLTEAGVIGDERCGDALALLASKQLGAGGFPAEKKHYRVGRDVPGASLVDWGGTNKKKMNPFVTVDAFHVLKATDRLEVFVW